MPKIKNAMPTIYNGVKYRSRLEAQCAKILDKHNIIFEYEKVKFELLPKFQYMNYNCRAWTYTPDFIIKENIILEVKGYKEADNYKNKRKMILYYLLNHGSEYQFYEIYSAKQLECILDRVKTKEDFNGVYKAVSEDMKKNKRFEK